MRSRACSASSSTGQPGAARRSARTHSTALGALPDEPVGRRGRQPVRRRETGRSVEDLGAIRQIASGVRGSREGTFAKTRRQRRKTNDRRPGAQRDARAEATTSTPGRTQKKGGAPSNAALHVFLFCRLSLCVPYSPRSPVLGPSASSGSTKYSMSRSSSISSSLGCGGAGGGGGSSAGIRTFR
jgi:hypothetical protein